MNGDDSIFVDWDDMTMAEVEEMSLVEAYASRSQDPAATKAKPISKNQQKTVPNDHNPSKTHHGPAETPDPEDTNSPVIAIQVFFFYHLEYLEDCLHLYCYIYNVFTRCIFQPSSGVSC